MCTVSYLPKENNDFVFTSNRDEAIDRTTIPPLEYKEFGVKVICPKDELAGGTWIGVSDKKRLVCLLNGGFEKHNRKSKYRHSRGKVVDDFLRADDFYELLNGYLLNGVEPFTLIILDWSNTLVAYELVWNEIEKHISQLDISQSKIWSSSTLYTQKMKQTRNEWFLSYFSDKEFTKENALDFHENYGIGNSNIDLQIDRGLLKTVSITNVEKREDEVEMTYKDLLSKKVCQKVFNVVEVI